MDEVELERLVTREPAALAALIERYQRRLIRFCLSFEPLSEADAQDLVQEVFMRVFRSLRSLREPARFESWLFAIARRRVLTALVGKNNQRRIQQRLLEEPPAGVSPSPEEVLMRQLEVQVVGEVIDRLEDSNLKRAGQLFYQAGRGVHAIAEELQVPVSTVTTWLSRFRTRVRKAILARVLDLRAVGGPS